MTTNTNPEVTLRQTLEDCAAALDVYRNPDMDEAKARIDEVLVAAGIGSVRRDSIKRIVEHTRHGYFEISTEWSARCCDQTSEYHLPTSIVDAPDPVRAAREYKHAEAVRKAEWDVKCARTALVTAQKRLADLEASDPSQNKEPQQ